MSYRVKISGTQAESCTKNILVAHGTKPHVGLSHFQSWNCGLWSRGCSYPATKTLHKLQRRTKQFPDVSTSAKMILRKFSRSGSPLVDRWPRCRHQPLCLVPLNVPLRLGLTIRDRPQHTPAQPRVHQNGLNHIQVDHHLPWRHGWHGWHGLRPHATGS